MGVALLLSSAGNSNKGEERWQHTRLHRPERSRTPSALHVAATQALQWGNVCPEDIASVWVAGMGNKNEKRNLLTTNKLSFHKAITADIDLISGYTATASPWLAIALAAEYSEKMTSPQLIMSMPEDDLPWWMLVHPATEQ